MNKKASILTDLPLLLILIFAFAIISGLFYYAIVTINSRMTGMTSTIQGFLGTGENATTVLQYSFGAVQSSFETLKWVSVLIIMALFLSILIHSFLVNSYPFFWVSYLFVWIMCIILSVPISNAYEEIYLNTELAEAFSGFMGQNYILLHLPTWMIIIGFLAGIILYVNFIRVRSSEVGFGE